MKYFIKTFGCAANEADSERIAAYFRALQRSINTLRVSYFSSKYYYRNLNVLIDIASNQFVS
jgi:hypothetical protein